MSACICCGCTDEEACPEGCHWLRVDMDAGAGVCSSCPEHVARFDAGDYSSEDWEAVEDPERAGGDLILPGDPDFHL